MPILKQFNFNISQINETLDGIYSTVILRDVIERNDKADGHILENIVFLELLRRGYRAYIGKVGDTEIDFIAEKPNEKKYIQVTESMLAESARNRGLRPLKLINDNYEKIVISMDRNYIADEKVSN